LSPGAPAWRLQAVTENLLAAEAMGMVDAGELEAACAASLANPPQRSRK
jgi:hypothetical protein